MCVCSAQWSDIIAFRLNPLQVSGALLHSLPYTGRHVHVKIILEIHMASCVHSVAYLLERTAV